MDFETKVSNIRDIVHALPVPKFDILKRIIEHLEKYVLSVQLLLLRRTRVLTIPFKGYRL